MSTEEQPRWEMAQQGPKANWRGPSSGNLHLIPSFPGLHAFTAQYIPLFFHLYTCGQIYDTVYSIRCHQAFDSSTKNVPLVIFLHVSHIKTHTSWIPRSHRCIGRRTDQEEQLHPQTFLQLCQDGRSNQTEKREGAIPRHFFFAEREVSAFGRWEVSRKALD